jgi:hypothetical protein
MMIPIFPDDNNPDGDAYPFAGSCAGCKVDETAKQTPQVCSKCKVVRYCRFVSQPTIPLFRKLILLYQRSMPRA